MIDSYYIQSLTICHAHEDYIGLHEIAVTTAAKFPRNTLDTVVTVCREAVRQLLRRHLVLLYSHPTEAGTFSEEELVPVPPEAVAAVLEAAESWALPGADVFMYWLATTEAGDAAYLGQEFDTSL